MRTKQFYVYLIWRGDLNLPMYVGNLATMRGEVSRLNHQSPEMVGRDKARTFHYT
jgi:hypothetical protein